MKAIYSQLADPKFDPTPKILNFIRLSKVTNVKKYIINDSWLREPIIHNSFTLT